MRIGIDIDDTIALTNDKLIEEALKFDSEKLKGKGFKNKKAYSFMEMFYWSVVDVDNFLKTIRNSRFFLGIEPISDAALYVNKLALEGNEIIFITRRQNSLGVRMKTKKWLKDHGFNYNKIFFGCKKKGEVCEREGISLFIDDDIKNIYDAMDYGVDVLLFESRYTKDEDELKKVATWADVYKYVSEVSENGKNS